jgi:hypothetical protein
MVEMTLGVKFVNWHLAVAQVISALACLCSPTGANNAADKFRKISNRIIALSAGKNSRIDDSFFDDGE